MVDAFQYSLVQLVNGTYSVRSLQEDETFHPVIGPVAEAEALYVKQLRLAERLRTQSEEFVVWDIGLGAAANILTLLKASREFTTPIRILSFDHTLEPLRFALQHHLELGYFADSFDAVQRLLTERQIVFQNGRHSVAWAVIEADFPTQLRSLGAAEWPKPHAILFDAFSPAKNPEMWTQPLFASIYRLLDPQRPCAMPTYSRSTLLRVSLLLAGFYVGAGEATGEKEETTIAANVRSLIHAPLDRLWLAKTRRSTSAEPLWEPTYRQAPLTPETWEKLQAHPQFQNTH